MKTILTTLLASLVLSAMAADPISSNTSAPASMPAIGALPIPAPQIAPPPTPVFDIHAYGAKGDGTTYDTDAIQQAIDACAGTGGSVLLSNGKFLSAHLELKGKMTFYIAKDAVLLGGTRPEDYPVVVPYTDKESIGVRWNKRSLLYANNVTHLTLEGGGTIDGQGPRVQMSGKEGQRPSLIRIYQSDHVTVRNITLKNPKMWTQVYERCQHLLIEFIKVCYVRIDNTDGVDICDCQDVVVRNSRFDADDDCICLKSHSMVGIKDFLAENNTIMNHGANAIKIGTATVGPIEHLLFLNNTIEHANLGGVCIESVDGSEIKDVVIRNLDMRGCGQPFFIRLGNRTDWRQSLAQKKTGLGSIENVTIENVRITKTHAKTAPSNTITGIPGAKPKNITLKDLQVEMPGGLAKLPGSPKENSGGYPQSNIFGNPPAYGFYVRHAEGVKFENVTIGFLKEDVRQWLVSDDATVETNNCTDLRLIKSPHSMPPPLRSP